MRIRTGVPLAIAGILAVALGGGRVSSDGSESLGPASVTLAAGTGIASGGTGMMSQPGVINVDVPAGAVVKQVLLYWEGFMATNVAGDDTISISNGGPSTDVTGTLVGGPTLFFNGAYASVFRADITSVGVIAAGPNAVTVDGMEFTAASNGAGILVIFDDGSTPTTIDIRDGSDLAFEGFAGPLQTTVAQTFTFASSTEDRTAQLHMFFASVSGTVSGFGLRPTAIEITTNGPNGGTTVLNDLLDSVDGQEWDSFDISADIPAGATTLTLQAFSRDDLGTGRLPASFDWLAAGFAIEPDVPPGVPGRMTGGGSVFTIGDVRVTRGFEIHCDLREPNNLEVNWPGNKFHTTELTSAVCLDSPAVEEPPTAPFDTFIGTGVGKLNNKPGARIEFTFVDAGEPGVFDTARIKVYDGNNNLVLDVPGDPNVPGYLDRGNIQAHKDNKSLF